MSFRHVLLLVAGLLSLASCGSGVSLDEARRDEARNIRINPAVKRPVKLKYSDRGSSAAAAPVMAVGMAGGFVGGMTGGLAAEAITDSMNADERAELERMIHGTVGEAGKPLREAMAKSLERKKVAAVNRSGARSHLSLEYKQLGLIPLKTFSSEMQIIMEVEVTLTANDGTVLWKTSYGSYPHNDQLPVRKMEDYRANPQLFGKDLEATCAWVTDILADYLKWEIGDE
ncbi:MAG TPA: hypothetical protein VGE67_11005 [Haloferula sp.]